jgi:membrane protease YdiL (CAAX protease family)
VGTTVTQKDRAGHRRWGLSATLGFSALILAVFVLVQVLVVSGFVLFAEVRAPELKPAEYYGNFRYNGLLLAVSTFVTTPVCLGLMALFIRWRRGLSWRDYLALKPVAVRTVWRWVGLAVLLVAMAEWVTWLGGRPLVPEFMIEAYRSATWMPLFWAAIVVVGPLFEELFFRGFLFEGLQHSRLGARGAVLVTALLWSVIHTQYDLFELGVIFAGGVLLGVARWRTGSTVTTLVLHMFWNLAATVEVLFYLNG